MERGNPTGEDNFRKDYSEDDDSDDRGDDLMDEEEEMENSDGNHEGDSEGDDEGDGVSSQEDGDENLLAAAYILNCLWPTMPCRRMI